MKASLIVFFFIVLAASAVPEQKHCGYKRVCKHCTRSNLCFCHPGELKFETFITETGSSWCCEKKGGSLQKVEVEQDKKQCFEVKENIDN